VILDRFRLDGKVAVISAAGRGIGAAIARAFAEVGARVVIGARTSEQLAAVASDVEKAGSRAVVVEGDLRAREGMATLVEAAMGEWNRIDVVVNNAGGSMPRPFPETREQEFEEGLRWNVTSAFNLSQLALPHLVASGAGSIINIASSAGRNPARGFAGYGTAKAALIQFTRNLALEVAPRVRVNAIAPGSIGTTALDTVLTNETLKRQMIELTPLRRIGREEDIAAGAVYLASEAASYVTGRVLDIDGGIRHSNLDMGIPDLG